MGLAIGVGAIGGCGGADEKPSAGLTPAATIVVDGSSTVVRISEAAQNAFKAVNPAVTVTVDEHGTGGGFARYLQNEVDIVNASRDAKPDEEKKAKEQGIEWTRFLVGYDGITLVVNPKNDFVKELSVDQLKAIWAPGSKVKTWKDVDPSWPDRPIVFYSPDNDSGTFEFFTEAIVGKAKSQRDDVQQNSSDNSLVQGVAGDPDGLGYFGYAYYASNKDKLRAVAVRNGKDAKPVLPSPETIKDKSYAPAVAPALHLREEFRRAAAGGRPVPPLLPREHRQVRRGGRLRRPDAAGQGDEPGGDEPAPRRRCQTNPRGEEIEAGSLPSPPATTGNPTAAPAIPELWSGHSRLLMVWEAAVTVGLVLCAVITVLTTVGIILVLGVQSYEFFSHAHVGLFEFLFGTELKPDADPPRFGIVPLIWGTFLVAAGSSMIALPIGLFSAIYLSEYAPRASATCSSRRSNCWRASRRSSTATSRCCS